MFLFLAVSHNTQKMKSECPNLQFLTFKRWARLRWKRPPKNVDLKRLWWVCPSPLHPVGEGCSPDRSCSQLSAAYSSLQQAGWLHVMMEHRPTRAAATSRGFFSRSSVLVKLRFDRSVKYTIGKRNKRDKTVRWMFIPLVFHGCKRTVRVERAFLNSSLKMILVYINQN